MLHLFKRSLLSFNQSLTSLESHYCSKIKERDIRDSMPRKNCCSFGFFPNYPPPHSPYLDKLYNFFWMPKTSIWATFKMTHYPEFFLNKGRIFALWVMYTTIQPKKQFKVQIIDILEELPLLTKNALMKRSQKIWASPHSFGQNPKE